jgi:hypothetical protein
VWRAALWQLNWAMVAKSNAAHKLSATGNCITFSFPAVCSSESVAVQPQMQSRQQCQTIGNAKEAPEMMAKLQQVNRGNAGSN